MNPIYLDHNGTTPVDARVFAACAPYLEAHFGNPSTKSIYGQTARQGLDRARQQVADFLGCSASEIYFTSGATESNNWVLQGLAVGCPHYIISSIEHPSVGKCADYLEKLGRIEVTRVGVDGQGRVRPEEVAAALRPHTRLVSLMHSNNEVGSLQPIAEVAQLLPPSVYLHTDAAQSSGKVPISIAGVHMVSLAGHKVYAPKGIGALYVRKGVQLDPIMFGAGHESGWRSGTENVAGAVALGEALSLVDPQEEVRLAQLRDHLQAQLMQRLAGQVSVNGHPQLRLPNTLSINFHGTTGAEVTSRCPEIAASTGPACHDGVVRLSHVLSAMGVAPEVGKGVVRLSLGRSTTQEQIDLVAEALCRAYAQACAQTV
jgi:cysteine desulfurase